MENKQVYLYLCLWSFKDKFFYTLELITQCLEKLTFYFKNMEKTIWLFMNSDNFSAPTLVNYNSHYNKSLSKVESLP